ncbi:MAG: ATP synthase F1 subunit gamma [Deltaproteobacteria bacterium]|nr:ATP synthase F1 subunit gamma [Deltaproteobacteria bacterium]
MPSLKTYRTRIKSVKNTQKITRAMKLVSAAKLRRAQMAALNHREYANGLRRIITEMARRAEHRGHPLLQQPENGADLIVLVTSDRGLCGGFNGNLSRRLRGQIMPDDQLPSPENIQIRFVGRKGQEFFKAWGWKSDSSVPSTSPTSPKAAQELERFVVEGFTGGKYRSVTIAYNKFKSAIAQEITFEKLLPISVENDPAVPAPPDYIYEPAREEILSTLLPRYVASCIQQAILESVASEHAARMTAMESATKNCSEAIGSLTLQMNRARQALITKELMEIIGGAESLKG